VSEADTVRVNEGIQTGQPLLLVRGPGAAVLAQRHEPVGQVGKVPDPWPRRGRVEVDERGQPPVGKHHVVRRGVVVAHDFCGLVHGQLPGEIRLGQSDAGVVDAAE